MLRAYRRTFPLNLFPMKSFHPQLRFWVEAAAGASGGLISGLSQIGAQKRQYRYTKKLAEQQNQYSIDAEERQQERDIAAFNREADFASKSIDRNVAAYERNGFNRALALEGGSAGYGNVSMGSGSTSSAPDLVGQSGNRIDPSDRLRQSQQDALLAARLTAEIGNTNARTENIQGETSLQEYTKQNLISQVGLNNSGILRNETQSSLDRFSLDYLNDTRDLSIKELDLRLEERRRVVDLLSQDIKQAIHQNSLNEANAQSVYLGLEQQIKNLVLTDVRTQAEKAGVKLTYAQIEKVLADTGLVNLYTALERHFGVEQRRVGIEATKHATDLSSAQYLEALKRLQYADTDKVFEYIRSVSSSVRDLAIGAGAVLTGASRANSSGLF